MQLIETRYGSKGLPSFSPDGQRIDYLGQEQRGKFYQNNTLYIVPVAGGESRNLSTLFDLHLAADTLTDTGSGTPQTPPTWSKNGEHIFCQATERGNQPLLAFAVDPQQAGIRRVVDGAGLVGSFTLDREQQKIAYLWGSFDRVGQVWIHEKQSDQSRPLSSLNNTLLQSIDLGQIEEVTLKGPDGVDLDGWILKPPGFDPAQKYASILEIHGGPHSQYGRAFMHEFYFLAVGQANVLLHVRRRG